MKIEYCEQQSPEWFELKRGRIGGTRFQQVISGKKNRLIYDLLDEQLSEFLFPDDYISDDMQFGIDNEPIACDLYADMTGLDLIKVGAIMSDFSDIHLASPDRITSDLKHVVETKCTQDGGIHIQRFFDGPESSYMPQIKNYFAVSDQIESVHWVSYCPSRPERPIVAWVFTRDMCEPDVTKGRELIKVIETKLIELRTKFTF